MQRISLACTLLALLAGCANFASPIPEGYQGPLATIKDSATAHSSSKADFYYVTEVAGKRIEDSRSKTLQVNYGRGMNMDPVVLDRQVPAGTTILKIVGRTEYAAPILTLTNPVYQVLGEVTLDLEPGKTYVVRGELGENYSAVWVEDASSNRIVGSKVEIQGSGSLGFFEK
jgi:hypothetical protein